MTEFYTPEMPFAHGDAAECHAEPPQCGCITSETPAGTQVEIVDPLSSDVGNWGWVTDAETDEDGGKRKPGQVAVMVHNGQGTWFFNPDHLVHYRVPKETVAACCGLTQMQSEDDGYDLVQVGRVWVCGECLVQARLVEPEPTS